MSKMKVQSYEARMLTVPPTSKEFPVGADAVAALGAAKGWVEDQLRTFLTAHPLPHDFWHAGIVLAVAREEGGFQQPTAELTLHTEEGEYVFDWDEVE